MQATSALEVTHEPDEDTVEATRRAAFIQALRDCAVFLERHPSVHAPRYVNLNVFVNTREDIASHARAATWEKIYNDDWFYLRREFGNDLSLDITTQRDTVCRKVITGTRTVPATPEREVEIVEWVCDDVAMLAARSRPPVVGEP